MKTKRFFFIGAVLLAAVGTFVYQNQKSVKQSDLALDNIEAISSSESGTEITNGDWIVTVYSPTRWTCNPDGGACCPGYDC